MKTKHTHSRDIFITIIIATLASVSVLYMRVEFKKPISKETMIEIYQQERNDKCYGDHTYHCNEYYDYIINKTLQNN